MSLIISRVTLTITIRPNPDGSAQVETRAEPANADVLMLSQAMLGVMAHYLQQLQGKTQMLAIGSSTSYHREEGEESDGA